MGVSGGGSSTASEEKKSFFPHGVYPAVSLKEARKRREEAKEQIAMGIAERP